MGFFFINSFKMQSIPPDLPFFSLLMQVTSSSIENCWLDGSSLFEGRSYGGSSMSDGESVLFICLK